MKKIIISLLCVISVPYSFGTTHSLSETTTLTITRGNIMHADVEAIVNAANAQLKGGSGVCGAIFSAAGSAALQKECDAYPLLNRRN